jgi:DNA polymerase V
VRRQIAGTKNLCKITHIFLNTNQFRTQDQQYYRSVNLQFPVATNFTPDLIKYALRGLDVIFKPGLNYHKVGCMVMDLVPESVIQSSLFDDVDRAKNKKAINALDKINAMMGKETVRFAVQGFEKRYRLRAEHKSRITQQTLTRY